VPTLVAEGHLYKMQVVWSLSCGTLPIHPVEIIDETDVQFTAESHQRDSSDNQGLNILNYILEVSSPKSSSKTFSDQSINEL
jgi:hypothetical protein